MYLDDGGGGGAGGLFLATIPIPPGDPGTLAAAAGTYSAAHGEIDRNRAALAREANGAGEAQWIGVGSSSFSVVSSALVSAYDLTSAALAKGATALRTYSTALKTAQDTAHKANAEVALTNQTATALLAAQATARSSAQASNEASQQSQTAQAHATAHPHSPAAAQAAQTAQQAATDAENTANADAAKVTALTSKYDAERAQALKLCALAKQQATTAASNAATGFDGATLGLLDNKPKPAKGGAPGDKGSPWEVVIGSIEKSHTALGFLAVDGILWQLGKGAEYAEKWMDNLPKLEGQWLHEALPWGQDAPTEEWQAAVHSWWTKSDAAEAFGEQFVKDTKFLGLVSKWGRVGGGPIAIAGDVITMIDPPQAGVMGNVDRVVAGGNAVLVGADAVGAIGTLASIDAISFSLPPVGVALAVGTGLYLAGAYAYKHWAFFRNDIANPIGHAAVDVVKGIGSGISHGISSLGHDLTSWANPLAW
jgi:hypothetical protein